MNTTMITRRIPVEMLKPAKYNPRVDLQPGDPVYEKIKKSLDEYGYVDPLIGRSPYQWQHEPVLFGWLPNGKHKWYADRKQTTIWNYDKPKKNAEHPTMKPIPLVAYPIKNSSAPNGVVMDLFGGSGSTLMACDQTDRICKTMELDERYASVIVDRYIQFHEGATQNVKVLRDGTVLTYEEAMAESKPVE